jgi:extradiol dioxygenase family protein
MQPFHLAFPVRDLAATRAFFVGVLGCREGRACAQWIDFDLFGHQITAHLKPEACRAEAVNEAVNEVDGDGVPVRHFGVVLTWADWQALVERLRQGGTNFRIAPKLRFPGEVGEQATFFLEDPSGNALEFKSFRDPARLFARTEIRESTEHAAQAARSTDVA